MALATLQGSWWREEDTGAAGYVRMQPDFATISKSIDSSQGPEASYLNSPPYSYRPLKKMIRLYCGVFPYGPVNKWLQKSAGTSGVPKGKYGILNAACGPWIVFGEQNRDLEYPDLDMTSLSKEQVMALHNPHKYDMDLRDLRWIVEV